MSCDSIRVKVCSKPEAQDPSCGKRLLTEP